MKDVIHELIGKNTLFDVLSSVFGFISAVGWFIECYEDDKKLQLLKKAAILSALVIIAGYVLELSMSIGIISLLVWLWIIERRIKRGRKIEENVEEEIRRGLKEETAGPRADESDISQVLGETSHVFVNAGKCLAENRPMEAVKYLNNCSARQIGQVRYFTYYADAYMMLGKYEWALAKLDAVPADKKKKSLKAVMRRKASCYRNLNRYADELDCYDVLLKNNYHPEKYYYQRGRAKVRILEVAPFIASADDALHHAYGTEEGFVKSIFDDLDRALQYGDEFGAEILSYKGACYFYQKKYKEALEAFSQSQQQKKLANNLVYPGICHYQENNLEEARTYFTECLAAEPDNDRALFYMAQISYQEKKYDEAILYASKSISVFPYRDECFWVQGMCYYEKSAYIEAISCFTKAIERKEKAVYYRQRAFCFLFREDADYEQAYKDALRCWELEDMEFNRLLVLVYKTKLDAKNGHKAAEEEIDNAVKPYTDSPENYNNIGVIYHDAGHLEKAAFYYKRAIKYNRKNGNSRYNLAKALRASGKTKEAAEQAEKALSFEGGGIEDLNFLRKCYRDLNDTDKEIETQLRISELRSLHAKLNKKNGDEVYKIGKYEAAKGYYQAALKYAENSSPILNNMGCACCCLYQYDEAQSYLEKAITSDSSYYLAYFNLGNCCLCTGDTAEELRRAKEYFRKAQTFNPQFRQSSQMLESMDRKNIRMAIDET